MLLLSLLACGNISFGDLDGDGDGKTTGTSTTSEGCIAKETLTESSSNGGYATFEIDIAGDDQVFQLVTEREDGGSMTIDYVVNPDGQAMVDWEQWLYGDQSLTYAFYLSSSVSVMNFPIREEEGKLSKGTWQVYVGTYSDGGSVQTGKKVTGKVITRACQGNRGTLSVVLAYAKGLKSDSDLVDAVDQAVEHWREIYDQIGVDLEVSSVSTDLGVDLKAPEDNNNQYESLYKDYGDNNVIVTIGDTIGGDYGLYGQSGGIPGPMTASPLSTVAVAWITHAGSNGSFSPDEIELFGETMAHEVGHYLGLFHPVEMTYDYYDALGDTQECSSMGNCEDRLGTNLMFPYPICSSTCENQDVLTDDQGTVARNWVGVK